MTKQMKNLQYADIPVTILKSAHKYGPTVDELQSLDIPEDFYSLTGKMSFTMLNDAMFHIVLEANPALLKELICSLMPLKPEEIISLTVMNPLEIGKFIDDKTYILDVKALLNNNTVINIELQVNSLSFWNDRSMEYLCRIYDDLNKGASYKDIKPAIHIGIVNFDTDPEVPEFYSTYHFANDKTHRIYTGKMRLSVLHLKRANIATEEDTACNRHFWAEFFNVKTWEDMLMLAKTNPVVAEAAKTIYRATAEERTRNFLESAERGERTMNTLLEMVDDVNAELSDAKAEIALLRAQLAEALGTEN